MTQPKLSDRQTEILSAVMRTSRRVADAWYRAGQAGIGHPRGEAVTLESLWRLGFLERRAWRGVEGQADAAHEYRIAREIL